MPSLGLWSYFGSLETQTAPTRTGLSVDGVLAEWRNYTSRFGYRRRSQRALRMAHAADRQARELRDFDAETLTTRRNALAALLRKRRTTDAGLVPGLALVREVCRREIGITLYVEQMAGGIALLSNAAVEMDTGEGKTLTTLVPAVLRALSGRAVHVVTANDYLAERDGALLAPVIRAMGLSAGIVVHDSPPESRRAAYAADVTFVSNKEVAFDYLRDRLIGAPGEATDTLSRKLGRILGSSKDRLPYISRGLDVAIVDEIDSVLIDDAGTPLIISGEDAGLDGRIAADALQLAAALRETEHYVRDGESLSVTLTPAGQGHVDRFAQGRDGPWRQRVAREELAREAVTAIRILEPHNHYLVDGGKVVMIDPNSGRRMPDRYWGQNLQAILESKEGLASSGRRRSLANISYQRFFRSYRSLSGMSGTVSEVAGELARVYGLHLAKVPRRRPNLRTHERRPIFAGRQQLWTAAADIAAAFAAAGRPVLIGVRSVKEAERGSAALSERSIAHTVLSAAQDAGEADIVAGAGEAGRVTIATNMAGRGTDIKLGRGVAESGGLLLLLCERHDSRRVDRQLMGRCARQGDPGTVIELLSAEDALLPQASRGRDVLAAFGRAGAAAWPALFRQAQRKAERRAAKARLDLVRRDEHLRKVLAIAGGLD